MRLGLLIGFTALLLGGIIAQGRSDSIKPDEGFGPPSIGNCSGGKGCGMTLVVDNSTVWEAVEGP